MHFNGQSTVALDGDYATGETHCVAHHVYSGDDGRKVDDRRAPLSGRLVKADATRRFSERRLDVRWIETCKLEAAAMRNCPTGAPPSALTPAPRRSAAVPFSSRSCRRVRGALLSVAR
jgi:hypothetical protein